MDQGLNLYLLHWQVNSLLLSHQGSPLVFTYAYKFPLPLFIVHCFVLVLLLTIYLYFLTYDFPGGSEVRNLPANARDVGSIPVWGRSPGEGNGKPLLYSCLGNPMDSLWTLKLLLWQTGVDSLEMFPCPSGEKIKISGLKKKKNPQSLYMGKCGREGWGVISVLRYKHLNLQNFGSCGTS